MTTDPCEGSDEDALARTPRPPYVAVIFTSRLRDNDPDYELTAREMVALAHSQPGFLGIESARETLGITVSYWSDEDAARSWKRVSEHLGAQHLGKTRWYEEYRVRIATIVRDYGADKLSDSREPPTQH
ncbi:MAG: antibiotic biosynthesis monooxygenase family protein [Acidimicrobiales bacterium]